jgi:LysR family transcriptional regulator, low CO2-responsive transcriptional regulator
MTYHQLRTFLTVARTGNLTKAARELKASQPTVSLQLRALRKSLETTLLERHDGGFRLTPAGEKLRCYAEDVLGGLRTLQQDIEALKGVVAGPLAVGVTFVVSRFVLPSVLSRFRAQFPGVDLQLHVDNPEPLFNGLLTNTLDVACYLKIPTPPGLTIEPVGAQELVMIASPRHPLAGRRRVSPRELNEHPFVAFAPSPFAEMITAKLHDIGVTPRVAAEGRHHDAVKKLVESNVGYAMVVGAAATDDFAGGRFVALRLDGPPILGELVMAYRSRSVASPLTHEIIRFVRTTLDRDRHVAAPGTRRRARAPHVKARGPRSLRPGRAGTAR